VVPLPEVPFFIVGSPRSGTTLLRFILSSHPRLYVPGETGFLPFLRIDPAKELSLQEIRQILHTIGRLNRNWHGMVDDPASFYQSLPEPTLPHLLDALYRRKVAPQGAIRWGDKTPSYVRYISAVHDIFPSAQFVHLIRDGRDVTLSARAKWGENRWYMDTYYLLKNWVRNVEAGRRAGRRLGPDRYLEIHYEELVQRPGQTIAALCSFLNERFAPAMLDHTPLARQQIGPEGHVETRRPISTASVYRWRSEMALFDQKMASHIVGPTLSSFGYERPRPAEPLRLHEKVKLRLLATKYQAVDAARTALTFLGILTLNRGKRR
jgi:hypothetical protein